MGQQAYDLREYTGNWGLHGTIWALASLVVSVQPG